MANDTNFTSQLLTTNLINIITTNVYTYVTNTITTNIINQVTTNVINYINTNLYTWSTFPSNTNSLSINNSYWKYISTNNVGITNITGTGAWASLSVSNSSTNTITLSMTVGRAGVNSTNLLSILAGKWGIVSYLVNSGVLTNYCTTTFQ